MRGTTLDRLIYFATSVVCIVPLVWQLLAIQGGGLSTHDHILVFTGVWGLRLLVLVLAIRPAAQLLRQRWIIRCRRIIGLFAFAYVASHVFMYVVVGQAWREPLALVLTPYLAIGMLAFILLIPMAATSSNTTARMIGGNAWKRLHQSIYVIAPLSVLHHLLAGGSAREGMIDGGLIALLLAYRVYAWRTSPRRSAASRPKPSKPAAA